MANWINTLADSKSIEAIFGKRIPPLDAVDLHEILVHRDGPRVVLRFELSAYPSPPPQKWQSQGYNRAQVKLMLIGVTSVQISGWSTNVVADIDLVRQSNAIRLTAKAASTNIQVVASTAMIESISGYRST
jgi:hypothetical protein